MSLVSMKRLRAVAPQGARRALLRRLYKLGCVEVETAAESTDFGAEGAALANVEENTGAREFCAVLEKACQTLDRYSPPPKKPLLTPKRQVSERELFDEKSLEEAMRAAKAINRATEEMASLSAEQARCQSTIASLKPWLGLDVPLDYEHGGHFSFLAGVLPAMVSLGELESELSQQAPEAYLEEISSDAEQHYITLTVHESCREKAVQLLKLKGFAPASFKGAAGTALESTRAQQEAIARMNERAKELGAQIASFASARTAMENAYDAYRQEAEQDQLLSGLARTKKTVILTGWLPEKAQPQVAQALEEFGCAYSMEDPQEGEDPPTAMENGPIAEPFTAITEMYGMPRYGSLVDPNPLMVPFYITFFGFIMGDAIYGIIIALGCFLGLKLMKPKGSTRQMLTLFMYCGFGTIIAGILMGGWLSDAVPLFTEAVLGKRLTIPPLWFNPLEDPMKMLIFSMVLGAIQIITGMAVSAWRQIKQKDYVGALCDTGAWYVIFLGVGLLALGLSAGKWLALGGAALILLLGGHDKKGIGKVTGGLGKLYSVTGFVSDLLSYSRIMALGLSGAVVGSVINKMGTMAGGGIVGVLLFVVVGLIGHTFNVAISVLGAYVHTSRLQYIEFFGRFYEDGGRIMRPLQNKTKYVEMVKED